MSKLTREDKIEIYEKNSKRWKHWYTCKKSAIGAIATYETKANLNTLGPIIKNTSGDFLKTLEKEYKKEIKKKIKKYFKSLYMSNTK